MVRKRFFRPNLQGLRKSYLACSERVALNSDIQCSMGAKSFEAPIPYPMGTKSTSGSSPQLSCSHYRALMWVENENARNFYEREAIAGGWDKRTLARQIQCGGR
jgi:hypothetical protein